MHLQRFTSVSIYFRIRTILTVTELDKGSPDIWKINYLGMQTELFSVLVQYLFSGKLSFVMFSSYLGENNVTRYAAIVPRAIFLPERSSIPHPAHDCYDTWKATTRPVISILVFLGLSHSSGDPVVKLFDCY